MTNPTSRLGRFWIEWAKPVLVVILVVSSFRSTFADWNDVPSGSMRPTILEGDRVFLNKMAYDLRVPFVGWRILPLDEPQRGDIVIFPSPRDGVRLIKRIVGVPGDTIEGRGHQIYVNGKPLAYESLDATTLVGVDRGVIAGKDLLEEALGNASHPVLLMRGVHPFRGFPPRTLANDEYFMMGDNRDDSADSRIFGPVKRDTIQGKALAVALSLDPENYYLPRLTRWFTGLR
jgi:signal peptidase I